MRQPIAVLAVVMVVALSACVAALGSPSTRALENGAAGRLDSARSLELKGGYTDAGGRWTIDLQIVRPSAERVVISGPLKLEAIIVGRTAYFRGQEFLAQHLGADPLAQQKVRAAGNAWWKGAVTDVPQLPDFTEGTAFKATFLGPVASRRVNHLSVDGSPAVDLAGVRGDVYISAQPPYQPLRVRLSPFVVVDGLGDADLQFTNFDAPFAIAPPTDVIDFSDLSTLPPIYYVASIDTSGCAAPCALSAGLRNLGGATGAKAPSTVTFTVADAASGRTVGTCAAQVIPDVGYNATTTVGCTIADLNGQQLDAAIVTVGVDNPGRA